MRRESAQRLDFPKIVDLLERVEVILHALDGHKLAGANTLRFQYLTESPFSFLGDEAVL